MAQDLSKSVPMVFRSLGKPLIKLFHLLFNSKCHFVEVSFIQVPIVLPIVLPKGTAAYCCLERQQPGPGPAGSWAGPAWFKMLLGLGGNPGGGGEGKGVISCT